VLWTTVGRNTISNIQTGTTWTELPVADPDPHLLLKVISKIGRAA
jgi:hypothetical protein